MTRKFLFTILVAIALGSLLGNFLFEKYKLEDEVVVKEVNSIHFIYEGVYNNKEQAIEASKNIENKLIVKEDVNYVVYLGITSDNNNLQKLEDIYNDLGITTNVKMMSISNDTFLATLEQLDILISNSEQENEILNVVETILANYEQTLEK